MSSPHRFVRTTGLLLAAVVAVGIVPVAASAAADPAGSAVVQRAAASIKGRVVDSAGHGIDQLNYALYTQLASGRYQTVQAGPFLTGADGSFTLAAATGTTYKLQFFDTLEGGADRVPYTTTWYGGTAQPASTQVAATTFTSTTATLVTTTLSAQSSTLAQNDVARIADYDYPSLYADDYTSVSPVTSGHARTWFRNGVAIAGATNREYVVTAADAAATLTYSDTVVLGSQTLTVQSESYTVKKGTITAKTPKISGTARVGKTLKVTSGAWSPSSAKKTYRWYNNGKAIKNATKTTYKLPSSSKGDRITVTVTATKTNFSTKVATSKSVKVKAKS